MGNMLPPPSTNVPIVKDRQDPSRVLSLTPTWYKWFVDLVRILDKSGGTAGATPASRKINTTLPLLGGGDLTEDRTLTFLPAGIDRDVQINNAGELGSITGISATIVTAKITALGTDGEMVFDSGVLISQTPAT